MHPTRRIVYGPLDLNVYTDTDYSRRQHSRRHLAYSKHEVKLTEQQQIEIHTFNPAPTCKTRIYTLFILQRSKKETEIITSYI